MKIQSNGDYITYHIEPVIVSANIGELDTLISILNEVAYDYYETLSKLEKQSLAEEIIQKAISKIGEL